MTNHYLYDYKRTALNKFLEDIRSGFQTPYVRKTPRKHLKKLLKLLDNDSLWTNKLSDKQMTLFYDINEKINKYVLNILKMVHSSKILGIRLKSRFMQARLPHFVCDKSSCDTSHKSYNLCL